MFTKALTVVVLQSRDHFPRKQSCVKSRMSQRRIERSSATLILFSPSDRDLKLFRDLENGGWQSGRGLGAMIPTTWCRRLWWGHRSWGWTTAIKMLLLMIFMSRRTLIGPVFIKINNTDGWGNVGLTKINHLRIEMIFGQECAVWNSRINSLVDDKAHSAWFQEISTKQSRDNQEMLSSHSHIVAHSTINKIFTQQ